MPRNASLERHWLVQTFDPYWPDEVQGPVYYGEIIVRLQSESVMTDHVIRKIEIQLVSLILILLELYRRYSLMSDRYVGELDLILQLKNLSPI